MKPYKKVLFFFLAGFGVLSQLGALGRRDRSGDIVVYSLSGSSGVGLVQLFENPPQAEGYSIRAEVLANQDLMAARFISGEAQVGVLPPNMAAKLAHEGLDLRALAVIGTGMLSLLSNDPLLGRIEELRGQTVHVAGGGATPDYVFQKILEDSGLRAGQDLNLSYALSPPEIAQGLISGRITVGLLPEPFATMARQGRPDLRELEDLQARWASTRGGDYPMTLLVATGAFVDAQPRALNEILRRAEESISWVRANPHEAGLLTEKHGLGLRAPVVEAAIPYSNYVFIPGRTARPSLEALFRVFLEFNPTSIGALPPESFYHP